MSTSLTRVSYCLVSATWQCHTFAYSPLLNSVHVVFTVIGAVLLVRC